MNKSIFYQIIGLLIIAMAILSGCEINEMERGSGNVITQRRSVEAFQEIDVSGIVNVFIDQGPAQKISVVTDDDLQDIVEVETINGRLYVRNTEESGYNAVRMDVYITVTDINALNIEGVTSLYCLDTLELSSLHIEKANVGYMDFRTSLSNFTLEASELGDIELHGKATKATIYNQIKGELSAYGFKCDELYLEQDATGLAEVYVNNSLEVIISGAGDVHCKGNPKDITKTATGIGKLLIKN